MLETFPALETDRDAKAYRALAGYFLFSTFYDSRSGYLVCPYETVAQHVGVHPQSRHFIASYWFHAFGNDVWEVVAHPSDYRNGRATELSAGPGRQVLAEIGAHNLQPSDGRLRLSDAMVDLVTGEPCGGRRDQKRRDAEMCAQIAVPESHPAKGLADFLNAQPQVAFMSLVHRNWNRTVERYHTMSTRTFAEGKRKAYAFASLSRVRLIQKQYYTGKTNTQRIYAISPSINELPRELRKEILHGCVSLDARSVQLAIASKIWDMPTTRDFLEQGGSIWQNIQSHMGIGPEWKPFIKEALYSILFGRNQSELRYFLETGRQPSQRGRDFDADEEEFAFRTPDRVDSFLAHPVIAECVAAQERRLREIATEGKIVEASGFERVLDPDNGIDAKSLLAAEVQSWEIALMSGLLETLRHYKDDVRVMSFLHDGIALWFREPRKAAGIVTQLKQVFLQQAQYRDFPTELEEG